MQLCAKLSEYSLEGAKCNPLQRKGVRQNIFGDLVGLSVQGYQYFFILRFFSDKTHDSEGQGVKQIIICCLMTLCVTIRIQFSSDVHSDFAYDCTQLESLDTKIVFKNTFFLNHFQNVNEKKLKKKKMTVLMKNFAKQL